MATPACARRDIDTGVVILTGEALRRRNAEAIADVISRKGGDFVTATAGNHMEAMLAAYGSGAAKLSHDDRRADPQRRHRRRHDEAGAGRRGATCSGPRRCTSAAA